MSRSGVTPIAIVGNPTTGYGADQVRTMFSKYNDHDHNRCLTGNWFTAGIEPLATVECISNCLTPVIANGTIVTIVRAGYLELSSPALTTISEVLIKFTNPSGLVIYVSSCSFTTNSNQLVYTAKHGFIDGTQLLNINSLNLSGIIQPTSTASYKNYPIAVMHQNQYYVNSITYYCPEGSCQVYPTLLNTNLSVRKTYADVVVGSSLFNVNYLSHSNNNNFIVKTSDTLVLNVKNTAANTVLSYTVRGQYCTPSISVN
jgi:hypothetical protein